MRRLWCLLFVTASACGAGGAGDDDGDDTSGDGGVGDANGCYVTVNWTANPTAGQRIDVWADVPGAAGGFLTYNWMVTHGGAVDFEYTDPSNAAITFTPAEDAAGPYYIDLDVDGTDCFGFHDVMNVRDPEATDTPWRIRFISPWAPAQEHPVTIPSGADFDYGEISLQPGALITGTVTDTSSTPVAAYLRLTGTDTPDLAIDGWAGSDGTYAISTTLGHKDLLLIPFRDDLPAMALTNWTPLSTDFVVTTGAGVTGAVHGPTGAGLVGATVTLTVDGVPSTVATTVAGGAFTMRARPGTVGLVVVDVVPPASSGLPRLHSSPAVLDLNQSFTIDYAASVDVRDVGGAAIRQGGDATPSATVTFTGTVAAAGTVQAGVATAGATGSFAIEVVANVAGTLPAALIPAVSGTAVVEPATGAAGVIAVDLTAGAPAVIDAPAGATFTGRVVDADGAIVDRADLRVTPEGALAAAQLDQVHVAAAIDGTFVLPLAGGGSYELTILDLDGDSALLRTALGTDVTNLGDIQLPDGLQVSGTVRAMGQSATNTSVTIFCELCTGEARMRPAAEHTTGSSGTFHATLVDPGVP